MIRAPMEDLNDLTVHLRKRAGVDTTKRPRIRPLTDASGAFDASVRAGFVVTELDSHVTQARRGRTAIYAPDHICQSPHTK